MNLKNRIALVTGAGQSTEYKELIGIGQASALILAEAGAFVYVNDVSQKAAAATVSLIRQKGFQAEEVVADVSDENQIKHLMDYVKEHHGRLDILVHCAAIQMPVKLFELTERQWKRVFDVNLFGTFCVCRAAAAIMINQKEQYGNSRGKIVNLTSIHDTHPREDKYDYDASKAGITSLTRELALTLAPNHINVNAIAPGAIRTPMNKEFLTDPKKQVDAVKKIPWGRLGESEEVARLVLFLSSDESDYLTGCVIPVDGGRSLYNG